MSARWCGVGLRYRRWVVLKAPPRLRELAPAPLRRSVRHLRSLRNKVKHKVLGSVRAVDTNDPVIALTYDDGPDLEHTPAVLAALARHDAHATFFVLADQAEASPELVRRMRAQGHEIGLHGAEHFDLTRCSLREIVTVIRDGRRRLEAVLGEPVKLFRPPYGRQTVRSRLLVRAFGMDAVLWSTNARDCFQADIVEFVANALDGLTPGGIVVLHDGYAGPDRRDPNAVAQSPDFDRGELADRLIEAIAAHGWTTIPVGALLTHGPRELSQAGLFRRRVDRDTRRSRS